MPQLIIAAAEGEHALYQDTLITWGNNDGKHRGSMELDGEQVMFRGWSQAQSSQDMWFHVLVSKTETEGANNGSEPKYFIQIRDGDSQAMAGWRDGDLDFSTALSFTNAWSSSASAQFTNLGNVDFTFNNYEWVELDIRIRITTGSAANDTMTVDWYVQQQLRDTQVVVDPNGWTNPRELYLTSLYNSTQRDNVAYQDVIVSDGIPTVGMELVTMQPAASGFYSQFVNNYTNLDELGYDPNDLIYATTAGQRESFILVTPTFDTSDKIIYAFVLSSVAQTDLGNQVADFQPFLRINANNYAGTNMGANNIAPDNYLTVWTQNPATLAPWVQSDFDGLEVGYLTV